MEEQDLAEDPPQPALPLSCHTRIGHRKLESLPIFVTIAPGSMSHNVVYFRLGKVRQL